MSEAEVVELLRWLGRRASTGEMRGLAKEKGWSESRRQRIGGTLRRFAWAGALAVDRKADRRCYVYQLTPSVSASSRAWSTGPYGPPP